MKKHAPRRNNGTDGAETSERPDPAIPSGPSEPGYEEWVMERIRSAVAEAAAAADRSSDMTLEEFTAEFARDTKARF